MSKDSTDLPFAEAQDGISLRDESELEIDNFNENPCMRVLSALILRVTAILAAEDVSDSMPAWMSALHKTFCARDTSLTIKLFLAKLILNCPDHFERFASSWIRPLIELLVRGDQYGEPMNYFVQDICVIIIAWGKSVSFSNSPDDRSLLYRLVNYLMTHASSSQSRITRNNVQAVKGVFDNWNKDIIVPTKTIYDLVTSKDNRRNTTGLQMAGIVLAHSLDLYYTGTEVHLGDLTETQFFTGIINNISPSNPKETVASAAEVAAWALTLMKRRNRQDLEKQDIQDLLLKQILTLDPLTTNVQDPGFFLLCVYRMHLHDDNLCVAYLPKIFFLIASLNGMPQVQALDIITGCVDLTSDIYQQLHTKGLPKMINQRNDRAQLMILKLLDKISNTMNDDQISSILSELVVAFTDHNNDQCREYYYKVLYKFYDQLQDFVLRDRVKVLILRGLIETNTTIRASNTAFIQTKVAMTGDIYDRSKKILGELYLAPVEDIYILYATQMLLQATKDSYEYEMTVFDEPLPNAHFDEHIQYLDTSWRNNDSMAPMFVATQSRTQQLSNEQVETRLRATMQSLQFSQTLSGDVSLMDMTSTTAPGVYGTLPSTAATPASVQGLPSSGQLFHPGYMPSNEDETKDTRRQQYAKLRRRFIETNDRERKAFFIQRHDRLSKQVAHYQDLQKQARAKKVSMLRKYRIGELPDIQIKYSELIEPLQALGRMDPYVARILFTSIIVTLTSSTQQANTQRDYASSVTESIAYNLHASTKFFSPTIGAFLRIYLEIGDSALDSGLVRMTSERSLNHHLGIAVLEKQIVENLASDEPRANKRSRREIDTTQPPVEKTVWINLAALYKSIDEPEIFESLYRTQVVTLDLPRRAVEAKLRGDIAGACNLFMDSMSNHHHEASDVEYKVWEQERLACFEQLTQWHDVAFYTLDDLPHGVDDLWSKQYQIPYMHHFIQSYSKLRTHHQNEDNQLEPWTKTNPNPIFAFIDQAKESSSHMEYLMRHHASEIALVSTVMDDYDRARHYVGKSFESLQDTWASVHPLASGSRMKHLAQLQRSVELEDFLNMASDIQRGKATPDKLEHYMMRLKSTYPDAKLDAMNIWDDILDSRSVYLEKISALTNGMTNLDDQRENLASLNSEFVLEMIAAARQQNNFNVAHLQLKQLTSREAIDFHHRNFLILQMDCQRAVNVHDRKKDIMARSLYFLLKLDADLDQLQESLWNEFHLTAGSVIQSIRELLQKNPGDYSAFQAQKHLTKFLSTTNNTALLGLNAKNLQTFIQNLTQYGFDHMEQAADSTTDKAQALWKFGDYCDQVLLANDNKASKLLVNVDTSNYSRLVIECYFEAMSLGHMQAVEHFPRLLELIERYPENGPVFLEKAENFHTIWYYIRWIPQLVAILDRPSARNIFPILIKLADAYPAALYYPFQISNEHYECYKEQMDPDNQSAIERIKNTIRSPLQHAFTNELRRLTNPEHIVKDFIDFIVSVGQKVDINNTFLEDAFEQFSNLVLNPSSTRLGTIPRAFAMKHGSQLRDLLGKNGSRMRNMSDAQRSKLIKYYQTNIQNDKWPGPPEQLRSYSPWLANFQGTMFDEQLEIPGQYHGRSAPNVDSHVKLASFDERLLVMSSLRKPKRLCIYGTDGKEYPFLVKGGEDLRLDQRIQQLFGVMNELVRKEPYSTQHQVRLKTYNVIPMSTNVGIIEWVNDTKPLRYCIQDQFNNNRVMNRVQESYRLFVSKHKGDVMGYHNLMKAPRAPVVNNFENLASTFRMDILRSYLLKLASSPEAFIFMRNNYAHDLAAICIAGYMLGIGDRHLENIMINKTNGSLLAIDFGHAFGSATELLPVPELMPFRLTRQLVGVLEPLGINGILEVAMTHVLDAIVAEKEVILNVMDVFVKEPLLDWKKVAAKRAKAQKREEPERSSDLFAGSSASPSSMEYGWYPQEKLASAKKKLDGVNPAHIMKEELARGHASKSYFKHACAIVDGDPSINIRAKVGEQCQSTTEQVQCLIDLATDPNILGRTWVGWQSYL
ncbi:hypothetical protein DM01DRAFT_1063713 [Hesseltinella vesiculosa]|uniref:DNA-dependent protein kinase catalytic subunit n=1 Tax=Hesseltinella vesiculosa TaxID=101127 RepID=A0A1X2GEC2_9FUNG|nr:hypothetical protein DM01DRAFT_1063713 [Hesseltinella vesiculosa]